VTLALGLSTPLRIKMWEAGFERLQTRFIPALAAAVNVEPLVLLDVDPDDPPLAALRIAAGIVTGRMGTAGMSVMSYQRIESGTPRCRAACPRPTVVSSLTQMHRRGGSSIADRLQQIAAAVEYYVNVCRLDRNVRWAQHAR